MSLSSFRNRSDQRVAGDVDEQQALMCAAKGCPHRWSVDAGSGKLCSHHAWAPAHRWPQITQAQLDVMADRARMVERPKPPVPVVSRAEKMKILHKLADFVRVPSTGGRRDWAYRIVERAEAGEVVSPLVLRIARAVAGKREAA